MHRLFAIMRSNSLANLLANVPRNLAMEARLIITKAILATDTARHVDVLARFNESLNSWSWDSQADRINS